MGVCNCRSNLVVVTSGAAVLAGPGILGQQLVSFVVYWYCSGCRRRFKEEIQREAFVRGSPNYECCTDERNRAIVHAVPVQPTIIIGPGQGPDWNVFSVCRTCLSGYEQVFAGGSFEASAVPWPTRPAPPEQASAPAPP